MSDGRILWCDVETTGLDPMVGKLLEVGLVMTDKNLEQIGAIRTVIHHDPDDLYPLMNDFVLQMHTDNNLINDVEQSDAPLFAAERELVLNVLAWSPLDGYKPLPMGGSTPQFDRAWLKVHMPFLFRLFNHRHVDLSSVCAGLGIKKPNQDATPHRALEDIRQDIACLKAIRNAISIDVEKLHV